MAPRSSKASKHAVRRSAQTTRQVDEDNELPSFCLPLVVRAAIGRINLPLINLRSNLNAFLEAVMTTTQTTTHPASDSAAGAAAPLQRFGSSGKPGFSIAGRRSPQELKKTMGMIDHIHLSSTQGPGVRLKLTDVL
ncbi:unnamed protein product [Tilletia controversa]|nr:unnamed protein product [Tilletia controversa]